MMDKIILENVSKKFISDKKSVEALKDIDLTVKDKEFLVIVGPSGCGKSTLLNMIAGFEKPSSGTVLLNGKKIERPGPDRGFVFQEFALYPWRTVLQNISFGLEAQGEDKKESLKKARSCVGKVGLEGFENAYPHTLSGGMKQRVGIARAMVYEPEVLLMDEPFVSLDAQTRNHLQELTLGIWEKTLNTVVFITHNVDEAVYLADRVAIMTQRPGTIKNFIDVPLPRPRDRTDPKFNSVRKKILSLLEY